MGWGSPPHSLGFRVKAVRTTLWVGGSPQSLKSWEISPLTSFHRTVSLWGRVPERTHLTRGPIAIPGKGAQVRRYVYR